MSGLLLLLSIISNINNVYAIVDCKTYPYDPYAPYDPYDPCYPTNKPTNRPTTKLTNKPTNKPTKEPTPSPTNNPSSMPTKQPTASPTKNPTTPSPTTPDELFCGDSDTGAYSGVYLEFNVQMAYAADLTFDASQSDFSVTTIEAHSKLNVPLGQDTDHDEILTLFDYLPGDYKFIIDGGTQGGIYNIQITCASKRPTLAPTNQPTPAPTNQPTPAIPTTSHTESAPSPYPTKTPTPLKSTTEIIKTTETIEYRTLHSSFWKTNSFTLILIGMVCGLFCIICCLFLLVILFVNNNYKRKNEEHTGIDESMKHTGIGENMKQTGIDDFFDGIDNTVMKQLPPKIVPNDIWNASVYSEALPLQNNLSPCIDNSDMESMYDSVQNKTQHMPIDLKIIDQMNENYKGEEEYEYYYE